MSKTSLAEQFFTEITEQKSVEDGASVVLKGLAALIKAAQFNTVDEILLLGCSYKNFSAAIQIAILAATLTAKDKFKNRSAFYDMCEQKLKTNVSFKKKAEKLLDGLK